MNAYEQKLADWSAELSAGRIGNVLNDLTDGSSAHDVERFLENAIEERRRMLHEELDLVSLAFGNFGQLVDDYLATTPRRAFELHEREPQRFLRWLRNLSLTLKQADFVTFQESEYACYELARTNREAHLSFQRLWNRSRLLAKEAIELRNYTLHANPTSIWTRLEVAATAGGSASCGDVVFLAVGTQILTLRPTHQQLELSKLLDRDNWITGSACASALPHLKSNVVGGMVHELIAGGLLALNSISHEPTVKTASEVKQFCRHHA